MAEWFHGYWAAHSTVLSEAIQDTDLEAAAMVGLDGNGAVNEDGKGDGVGSQAPEALSDRKHQADPKSIMVTRSFWQIHGDHANLDQALIIISQRPDQSSIGKQGSIYPLILKHSAL